MFIFIKNAHLEILFNFYVTLKRTGKMQIFTKRINITADFDNFVMGNDISSGLSFLFPSICFDFFSTYIGSLVIGTHTSSGFDVITH